jgi:hypothetical protein
MRVLPLDSLQRGNAINANRLDPFSSDVSSICSSAIIVQLFFIVMKEISTTSTIKTLLMNLSSLEMLFVIAFFRLMFCSVFVRLPETYQVIFH